MPTNSMNRVLQHLRGVVLEQDGSGLTDGQLVECFLERRDEAAVEMLVRRYGPMVLGVCQRVLRNGHDAEDAFQATFLVLVRKAASIRPKEMVGNWLYGVAYQTAIRARVAAAKRWVKEKQVLDMPEPETIQKELWRDMLPLLDQELKRLPAKYRFPIVLCDLEGKTYNEAARQLGCPQGTLSARLVRGRLMLAKRLTRHGMAVSGVTLAGLLSQNSLSASVPSSLLAATVKVAGLSAGEQAATAGVISAKVAALTEGVLKTMFLTKLKVATAAFLVATLIVASAGLVSFQTQAAGPPAHAKKDGNAQSKKSAEKSTYLVKIPSQLDGVVLFIGTEIKEGEKVPPAMVLTVEMGSEKTKFRRLKEGDSVEEGQLLARLDDRLARAKMAIKERKIISSKADSSGAEAIAKEAESKYKIAQELYKKGAISLEDLRSATLIKDKLWFDSVAKKEAVKLAEIELNVHKIILHQHEIRSRVGGVIARIHKHPGEAVRELETVFEIEVTKMKE